MNVFTHGGDLGDCIAALPVIRQLGGGHLIMTEVPGLAKGQGPRESMRGARWAFLEPLLARQPYLASVGWSDTPRGVTHDLTRFRSIYRQIPHGMSLAHWQAVFLGVRNLNTSPWLTVDPSPRSAGCVVVARSPRYHSGMGDVIWKCVAEQYRGKILFVGMPDECEALQRITGPVEHVNVRDALELAQLIAGAARFIGNQSMAAWIAMGVGAPCVIEVSPREPNTTLPRTDRLFLKSAADIRGFLSSMGHGRARLSTMAAPLRAKP